MAKMRLKQSASQVCVGAGSVTVTVPVGHLSHLLRQDGLVWKFFCGKRTQTAFVFSRFKQPCERRRVLR